MTGAIAKGPLFNGTPQTLRAFDSNATLARGDLVNVTSNQLEIAAPGERIAGVLKKAVTSASVGATVNITPYLTFLMDNDNDSATFAATDANSKFYDLIGGTGAQVVDTSSGAASDTVASTGQLVCLAFNPEGNDTSVGLFMIRPEERQF